MSEPTGTERAVCQDIADKQQEGIAKYGVTVAENPLHLRQWLRHAYEEQLDSAIYLKRASEEIGAMEAWILDAYNVISRGVELMPIDQLSQWNGVRTLMETCPIEPRKPEC